jgi:serine palmitoyltransferase
MPTAVSYLSAVQQADTRAPSNDNSVASTPSLSPSPSITASSEDNALSEDDENNCLVYPLKPPISEQVFTTAHSEFGHCANEAYRCVPKHDYTKPFEEQTIEEPPYYIFLTTHISLFILRLLGHMRDFFGKRFAKSHFAHLMHQNVCAISCPLLTCSLHATHFVPWAGLCAVEHKS